MYGFLYITTNLINGKRYLGQCAYHRRKAASYLGSGKMLKQAVEKYGRMNFSREVILEAQTKEELSQFEIAYIKKYDCVVSDEWYNLSEGGYASKGFTGHRHTEATRAKMSQERMNHSHLTQEDKRRIGEASSKRASNLNQKDTSCPHCLKIGAKGPMAMHARVCKGL